MEYECLSRSSDDSEDEEILLGRLFFDSFIISYKNVVSLRMLHTEHKKYNNQELNLPSNW